MNAAKIIIVSRSQETFHVETRYSPLENANKKRCQRDRGQSRRSFSPSGIITMTMLGSPSTYFHFRIPFFEEDISVVDNDGGSKDDENDIVEAPGRVTVPSDLIHKFQKDGFVVFTNVLPQQSVDALNDRLEDVLRGKYDRNIRPDKVPKLIRSPKPQKERSGDVTDEITRKNDDTHQQDRQQERQNSKNRPRTTTTTTTGAIGFSGNLQNVKVLQIINIHKADSLFRHVETYPTLGDVVAQLAGWNCEKYGNGARLAQDQVWAKPPQAPPLVFHRDSPYFMFDPPDVVTVWIALDDMDEELGPLQYVRGSHLWGDGRLGSANNFFQKNIKQLLYSAAEREGILDPEHDLDIITMAGLQAGGMSIHHGRIWHGSGRNESVTRPRRGLGLHFVPANVRFTADAAHSSLWKSYVSNGEDPHDLELPEEDFPLVSTLK